MTRSIELHGHRGARGLFPENTLAGVAGALEIGVDTLEVDVAMTLDGVVVVSHDPALNPDITRTSDGAWLARHGPLKRSLRAAELRATMSGASGLAARMPHSFPIRLRGTAYKSRCWRMCCASIPA
jgi:glycerophosphoryl diester phosphodiesterase